MIDSIIEKITNQRNVFATEKKITSLFTNIRGKILYSSDEILFSTDSGDFILKQNDSTFLKDGDFVRANIKSSGSKKYLQVINDKNKESHTLEIIGYNDKKINPRGNINSKNSSLNSINNASKSNIVNYPKDDISLLKSFKELFLGKNVDIKIIDGGYKNVSDRYNAAKNQESNFSTENTPVDKEIFYIVTDVKLKNQNKNNLPLNNDTVNISSDKGIKYCEVISLNSSKKLITKSNNDEIIIIDSIGKELPRGSIIKLETRDSIVSRNLQGNYLNGYVSDEVKSTISDKVFNLVEELRFVETIFYRFGSLIVQNTKTPKEKYKSILDLLKKRFSKKTNSSFNPKSLDKLSKEIISGDELKNILKEASDNLNFIKQELNYDESKQVYQVVARFVKNQEHTIEISEEEIYNEELGRKKMIHFSIDMQNLQTLLVKRLVGVVEFCYNNNKVSRLELKIFQDNVELEDEFRKNLEGIFNRLIKKESLDGEIFFCAEDKKDDLVQQNYSNNIGLRITI